MGDWENLRSLPPRSCAICRGRFRGELLPPSPAQVGAALTTAAGDRSGGLPPRAPSASPEWAVRRHHLRGWNDSTLGRSTVKRLRRTARCSLRLSFWWFLPKRPTGSDPSPALGTHPP